MGHWFWAAFIFVVGAIVSIPGYVGGARTPIFLFGALSFLIFGFLGLG